MSDDSILKDLEELIFKHGLPVVADALLELATGQGSIGDVLERAQRRAIRAAADAEAEKVLDDDA